MINLFCELVRIQSPSGKEEKIAKKVILYLEKAGAKVQRDGFGNIIAKIQGLGDPIIFCAHLDTVAVGIGRQIKPIIKRDKIYSDGKTILGADNKDSISAILETLIVLKENKTKHRPIEIVFTREEEAIARGALSLDLSLLKGRECVISDHCNKYGTIVTAAPGCSKFEMKVFGKRSHVKESEKGINAIAIASEIIQKMPLGKIDKYTCSNVGYLIAGLDGIINQKGQIVDSLFMENRNTIPDLAVLLGEARGIRESNLQRALKNIKNNSSRVANSAGGRIEFSTNKLTDCYCFDKKDKLIKTVVEIFKKQKVDPRFFQALGGSDANALNARGIHTIVVASAHRNNHTTSEFLIIKDLIRLANFFLLLAQKI